MSDKNLIDGITNNQFSRKVAKTPFYSSILCDSETLRENLTMLVKKSNV